MVKTISIFLSIVPNSQTRSSICFHHCTVLGPYAKCCLVPSSVQALPPHTSTQIPVHTHTLLVLLPWRTMTSAKYLDEVSQWSSSSSINPGCTSESLKELCLDPNSRPSESDFLGWGLTISILNCPGLLQVQLRLRTTVEPLWN